MHSAEEGGDPGIEVLLVQAGHDHAAHAPVIDIVGSSEGAAAIDRHAMAVIGEARADLLGKTLEAAITVGNAASSDDSNVHGRQWSVASDRQAALAAL